MNNNIVHHAFQYLWYQVLNNKIYNEKLWMDFESVLSKIVPKDNFYIENYITPYEAEKILKESSHSVFITTNIPDLQSLPWCLETNESPIACITHCEITELLINKRDRTWKEWVTRVSVLPNIIMR